MATLRFRVDRGGKLRFSGRVEVFGILGNGLDREGGSSTGTWRGVGFRRASTAATADSKPVEEETERITLTDNCARVRFSCFWGSFVSEESRASANSEIRVSHKKD